MEEARVNKALAHFFTQDYAKAKEAFEQAYRSPEANSNSYILMRLGRCCHECEQKERAAALLKEAYALGGEEVFEDEDAKYRECIEGL